MFQLFTPIIYWLLILLWTFILAFYIGRIRSKQLKSRFFLILISILAIDAFRTLFESVYFGAWYTSLAGLLPIEIHDFLVRPKNVFIPKFVNVVAAALVIILLRRWIPEEVLERKRQEKLVRELQENIEKRKQTEEELTRHRDHLDKLVTQRTAELTQANSQLRQEVNERQQTEAALSRANRALKTLSSCNNSLIHANEESELLGEVCQNLVKIGGYCLAWVGYPDSDDEMIEHPVAYAEHREGYFDKLFGGRPSEKKDCNNFSEAIRTGRPLILKNTLTDPNQASCHSEAAKHHFASFIVLPLRNKDRIFGALNIYSKDRDAFDEEELRLLEELASDLVYGIIALRTQVDTKSMEKQLRQAQKMEAIGTLAGGIAHDFNNILSAVMGYTELAIDQAANDNSVIDNLQEVLSATRRARDLVSQILTFSRQTEQKLQPVQIKHIVKEALKLLRASIPSTIEIRQYIQSDDTVMADPTQIHQILMNLCTNAYHAMRNKGGVLEVKLIKEDLDAEFASKHVNIMPGSHLRLSVRDTGHGMSKEVKERIFDPFFTTKKQGDGTGMGLSVVHGIVKTHGGAITVSSMVNEGSSFNVYLPCSSKQEKPKTEIITPLPTGSEHILFVDDEKTLIDVGKQMLERQGYRVTTRTSGIEALELFNARPGDFDLVVTDMTMPSMTGEQFAKEIKKIRPEISIILCTGFSEIISDKRAKAAGVGSIIRKPIIMAELLTVVRKMIDNSTSDTALKNDSYQKRKYPAQPLVG